GVRGWARLASVTLKAAGIRVSWALLWNSEPLQESTASCSRGDRRSDLLRVTLCPTELSDPPPEGNDTFCCMTQGANRSGACRAGATLNEAWIAGGSRCIQVRAKHLIKSANPRFERDAALIRRYRVRLFLRLHEDSRYFRVNHVQITERCYSRIQKV